MSTFAEGKEWSDKYIPEIKKILGLHLIQVAPLKDDCELNTDMLVPPMIRVAQRVRNQKFWEDRDEFTIRFQLPSGSLTEWDKLIAGHGDYFFYGHAGINDTLNGYTILNLKLFRAWCQSYFDKHRMWPGRKQSNPDGTSFRIFDWNDLPKEMIVAQWFNDKSWLEGKK